LGFLAALLGESRGFPLVLRRNVVTLAALTAAVGVGVLVLVTWWALTGGGGPVVAAITGCGLLLVGAPPLGALFSQLQRRLTGRFFRDEYHLPAALRALGEAVVALESATAIADYLLPGLGATLDLAWARLEIRPPGAGRAKAHAWGDLRATTLPSRTIPLVAQGELEGAIVLGPKRRGIPLRREDEALVGILAPLLASALRNARLIGALREERTTLADRERALVALGRRATSAVEAERLRLARDLHDVALADLGALRRELDQAGAAALAGRLAAIGEDVRGIIADLRPPELELGGLIAAVRGLVPATAARLGLELRLDTDECDATRWEPELELALYRVVQEALANAAQHGRATVAEVALRQRGATLVLTVSDDGWGPPGATVQRDGEGGLGLLGMRERVAPWGGTVVLAGNGRGGATLTVTVAVGHSQEAWETTTHGAEPVAGD
jgi:signal transduction histidine kinase